MRSLEKSVDLPWVSMYADAVLVKSATGEQARVFASGDHRPRFLEIPERSGLGWGMGRRGGGGRRARVRWGDS